VAAGRVYQTRARYARTPREFRPVEVELDRPPREGRRTTGVLTDVAEETLPAAGAAKYRERRATESASPGLAEGLRGEVGTRAYPEAALLAFGLAAAACNLLRVGRRAARRPAARRQGRAEASPALVGREAGPCAAGLGAALEGNPHLPAAGRAVERLRAWAEELAARLVGGRHAESKRGRRRLLQKKAKSPEGSHTATARILDQRRIKCQ
jgi:hypothetical protein